MSENPTPLVCPGCNTAWRHAEAQRLSEGTPHDLTPRYGEPVWCPRCAGHIRSNLASLPDLVARLYLEMENASPGAGEHVSGSKERPIHEREKYTFCIEDIDGILDSWATAVREDRHLVFVRPVQQGRRITFAARVLLIHLDWLIGDHPDPVASQAFGTEIRRIYLRASHLTHTDEVRPERCDGVMCPRCDTMSLEREIDWQGRTTGYIACRACETLLSAAEYERWTKLAAEPWKKRHLVFEPAEPDFSRLTETLTVERAMRAVGRSKPTIERWIREENLRVVDMDGVAAVHEADVVATEKRLRAARGGRPRKSAA